MNFWFFGVQSSLFFWRRGDFAEKERKSRILGYYQSKKTLFLCILDYQLRNSFSDTYISNWETEIERNLEGKYCPNYLILYKSKTRFLSAILFPIFLYKIEQNWYQALDSWLFPSWSKEMSGRFKILFRDWESAILP